MKAQFKKLFCIFISLLFVLLIAGCKRKNAPAPQIKKGEFPFTVKYDIGDNNYSINDTVVCCFDGYDHSNSFSFINDRRWSQNLKSGEEYRRVLIEFEPYTESVLTPGRKNVESRVILNYGFGGYYLGDPDYKDEGPCINYVEEYKTSEKVSRSIITKMSKKQLEKYFGIKITKFEFSEPIKNIFK
ncbi:MAG: hypothetical protein J5662_00725 [Clostridia bacterium]|nr:hypothetical protein [Clostridia bacterium]